MSSPFVFSVRNWEVRRPGHIHIGPVDLDLAPGQCATLLGPSGIGKTTLLMTWLGYRDLDLSISGDRRYEGNLLPCGTIPARALLIPQQLPFNPNWEVLGYLCRLPWDERGWLDRIWPTRPRRVQRVREVLSSLGLSRRLHATVAELSAGEIQRAALAQMKLLAPKLMVGDEFVANLDPGMSMALLQELRDAVVASNGIAILALHDVYAAMRVSNQVLLMWPPAIEPRPWIIHSESRAWHASVIHAALCLARWCTDIPSPLAATQLTRLFRSYHEDEELWRRFLAQGSHCDFAFVDGERNRQRITPAQTEMLRAVLSTQEGNGIDPVRIVHEGETLIGFTVPENSSSGKMTVLARIA